MPKVHFVIFSQDYGKTLSLTLNRYFLGKPVIFYTSKNHIRVHILYSFCFRWIEPTLERAYDLYNRIKL